MRRGVALIVVVAIGCSNRDDVPSAGASSAGSSTALAGSADLIAALPQVDGAKLIDRHDASDAHAVATWCIDQVDAVTRIETALRRDGWTDLHLRHDAAATAIAARRGDQRFSAEASTVPDDRCGGTVVHATVMRLGQLVGPGR